MVWTLAGLQVQARSSKTAICLSLVRFRLRTPEKTGRQLLSVEARRPAGTVHRCQRRMEKKQRRYLKKKRISTESSEESHQENRDWKVLMANYDTV